MAQYTNMVKPLKVSDLERIAGISRSSIHSYIKKGLLSEPLRTGKTMAYYNEIHLEELEEIDRLKNKGYPLSFIKQILDEKKESGESLLEKEGSPEKTKEKILENAVKIFSKQGYYNTRMNDIAESAGVSRSTLYMFTDNKRSLFLECADEVFKALIKDISGVIDPKGDPLANLVKMSIFILNSYPNFLEILLVVDNMVCEDPGLRDNGRKIYENASVMIVDELDKAVELGLIPEMDNKLFSFMIMGVTKGFSSTRQMFNQYTTEDFFEVLARIAAFLFMPNILKENKPLEI